MTDLNGKTILQIIPTLETGGAERTTIDIAKAIINANGKAVVASAGGRLVEEIEKIGGKHIFMPLDSKWKLHHFWLNKLKLIALAEKEGVDLIHARSRAPAFPAFGAAKALKVPFLTTYHGIYSEKNIFKRWYNSIMVSGKAVIANSNYTADLIKKRYKLPDWKIHVIHRGTDLELFDANTIKPQDQNALREKWHLPEHKPIIMLLGRLTDWKGHLLTIKAAEILFKQEGLTPHFVFVGKAQSETFQARVRSAIFEAGLMEDITLTGHFDNVPLALSLADLVIVPSTKPEAFGRSVAEASAMAKPVIAFDHGGATETILCPPHCTLEKASGLRIENKDAEALARTMKDILKLSPQERQAMGLRGRNHIKNNFTKEHMCQKTLALYVRLLNL